MSQPRPRHGHTLPSDVEVIEIVDTSEEEEAELTRRGAQNRTTVKRKTKPTTDDIIIVDENSAPSAPKKTRITRSATAALQVSTLPNVPLSENEGSKCILNETESLKLKLQEADAKIKSFARRLENAQSMVRQQADTIQQQHHQKDAGESSRLRSEVSRLRGLLDQSKVQIRDAQKQHIEDLKAVEEKVSCDVCMEILWHPFLLSKCGHTFCERCLVNWFQSTQPNFTCPHCRKPVKHRPVEMYFVKGLVEIVTRAQARQGMEVEDEPARDPTAKVALDLFFPRVPKPPVRNPFV